MGSRLAWISRTPCPGLLSAETRKRPVYSHPATLFCPKRTCRHSREPPSDASRVHKERLQNDTLVSTHRSSALVLLSPGLPTAYLALNQPALRTHAGPKPTLSTFPGKSAHYSGNPHGRKILSPLGNCPGVKFQQGCGGGVVSAHGLKWELYCVSVFMKMPLK